jgi:hypothetical protein
MEPKTIDSSILIDPFNLFVSVTDDIYIYNDYNDNNDSTDYNPISSSDEIVLDQNSVDQDRTVEQRNQREPFKKKKKCQNQKRKHTCGYGYNNNRGKYPSSGGGQDGSKDETGDSNGNNQSLNTDSHGQVYKLSSNLTNSTIVMSINGSCAGLFVIDNTIYCSMNDDHQVVKKTLQSDINIVEIVAGNGSNGSTSTMLNEPYGIFVDTDFHLYVADSGNHRIQRFRLNESHGETVAGNESNETMRLLWPTGVAVDANGSLFIADSGNHRIVESGPNGFRCIVGCSNSPGLASDQLSSPWSLSFDSYGNIFVSDWENDRIQKFILETNSCSKFRLLIIGAVLNNFFAI